MRTTCRLILGIAVLIAAAGVAFAQQPDPEPTLPPLPQAQVTPAPPAPEVVPPAAQTTAVPAPIPTAPDLVVNAPAKPVKKASARPAKKPAQVMASKKPIEKPATPESSAQTKEAAAAASVTVSADSSAPPPPGAAGTAIVPAGIASQNLSPKAPPAVDPVVQAQMDKKVADAVQRKKTVGGRILLGVGGLALIGLAFYFVRSRRGVNMVPPIFDGGLPAPAIVAAVAPVRSGPAR